MNILTLVSVCMVLWRVVVAAMEVEASRWWLVRRVRVVMSRKVVMDKGKKVAGGVVVGGDSIGEEIWWVGEKACEWWW